MTLQQANIVRLETFQRLLGEEMSVEEQVRLLNQIPIETVEAKDLVAYTQALYEKALCLDTVPDYVVDLVGTGGDKKNTFNISTTSAFIVAGAGINIAKHCAGVVTSQSGCLDLLSELQVDLPTTPEKAIQQLHQFGLTFLIAMYFHPVLKKLVEARAVLAKENKRTIFNLLGPLSNPANVKRLAIGVYREDLIEPFIETLRLEEKQRAIVFYGNGLDEFTLTGKTTYALLQKGNVSYHTLSPEDFGLKECAVESLRGGSAKDNAELAVSILKNECTDARRDMVLLNAATAIYLGYPEVIDLEQALGIAQESLDSGAAYQRLHDIQKRDRV